MTPDNVRRQFRRRVNRRRPFFRVGDGCAGDLRHGFAPHQFRRVRPIAPTFGFGAPDNGCLVNAVPGSQPSETQSGFTFSANSLPIVL
jgi:hypothetical protein